MSSAYYQCRARESCPTSISSSTATTSWLSSITPSKTCAENSRGNLINWDNRPLKGTVSCCLRNYEDLEPDRKARLDALLQVNQPLFTIHSMKEQLRLFWEKDNRHSRKNILGDLVCETRSDSGIKHLAKVAKTLAGVSDRACSTTSSTPSPAPWSKASTTKSKPSKGRLTDSGIRNISSSDCTISILRGTRYPDERRCLSQVSGTQACFTALSQVSFWLPDPMIR